MNIKRAKEEIEHTVKAYLAKDALGEYAIPAIRQRPILLMGPPGIGKTQVMEQVARECGVALVAYTITHHTRQSAVGLPFIRQRHYGDKDVSVTEYTMSEIIASIYAKMEATGLSEGILFIDEINCMSSRLTCRRALSEISKLPFVHTLEHRRAAKQRRLSGAGRADDRHNFPLFD